MKNLYVLATSTLLALTACSNDSTINGTTASDTPISGTPISVENSPKASSFETDGCKSKGLQKVETIDESIIMAMPEARLIQNGNSYQIEILNVAQNCGFSNENATTTTERVGNTLNVVINQDMLAKCGSCNFDIRVNIDQNDASASYVSFNGTTYLIVSQYTSTQGVTDTTTQTPLSPTYLADFTHSDCKGNAALAKSIIYNISDEAAMPTINLVNNEGSYHLLLNDVVRSCDFKPVTAVSRTESTLAIDIQDTSETLSDCICRYDFNIVIKPEDADAKYVIFKGTTYEVVSLKAVTQICYPSTNLKTLAKTDEYGMALSECKNTSVGALAKKGDVEDVNVISTIDSSTSAEELTLYAATLITEGAVTQVMIPDVLDNCGIKATINVSMTGNTIKIEYGDILAETNCVCVKDHWFDISSLGPENIAKATQVEFLDRVFLLGH